MSKEKFERRIYPSDLIVEQFERGKQEDRKNLIFEERKNKKKANGKVNFIFTYNQTNPPIHMWLRECQNNLREMMQQRLLEKESKFPTSNLGIFKKLQVAAEMLGEGGLDLPLMLVASSVISVK